MTDREAILAIRDILTAQLAPPVPPPAPPPVPEPPPDPTVWPPVAPSAPMTAFPEPRVWQEQRYEEYATTDVLAALNAGEAPQRVASIRLARPRHVRGIVRLDLVVSWEDFTGGTFEGIKAVGRTTGELVWMPTYDGLSVGGARRTPIATAAEEFWTPLYVNLGAVTDPFGFYQFEIDAVARRVDGKKTNARVIWGMWVGEGTPDPARRYVHSEGFLTTPGDPPNASGYFMGTRLEFGREFTTDLAAPLKVSVNIKPGWEAHTRLAKNGVAVGPDHVSFVGDSTRPTKYVAPAPELVSGDRLTIRQACASIPSLGSAVVSASFRQATG